MKHRPALPASALLAAALALGVGGALGADAPAGAPVGETAPSVAPIPTDDSAPVAQQPGDTPAAPAPVAAPKPEPIRLEPPRASLLPLAQPLWSELTPSQREILSPFASQWNALPLTEKRAWADLASRFPKMKPDEQARVSRRIEEWAALTPEQRRTARANYRLARQVARDNLLNEWENYQSMTPEQRSVLGNVGTSNTAARHVGAYTGLAREAAQPLPRRQPRQAIAVGTEGGPAPANGVAPTVGPAGGAR